MDLSNNEPSLIQWHTAFGSNTCCVVTNVNMIGPPSQAKLAAEQKNNSSSSPSMGSDSVQQQLGKKSSSWKLLALGAELGVLLSMELGACKGEKLGWKEGEANGANEGDDKGNSVSSALSTSGPV